jgi:fructose-bisphosphate aldolase class 1
MRVDVLVPNTTDRKRPSWAMKIVGINDEKVDKDAFRGEALVRGNFAKLEIGSLILFYEECMLENRDHDEPYVILYRVNKNGELRVITSVIGWDWFMRIKQKVIEALKS